MLKLTGSLSIFATICCCRHRFQSLATFVSSHTPGKPAQTRQLTTPTSSSASRSNNPYPYPSHKHPTPHQIFHLSSSASETDIKARYFDLVRIYHPDKAGTSVSPETAHERFQAITTAYDILRGKKPYPGQPRGSSTVEDRSYQTTAAYRSARRRRQELYSTGAVDDRWKDRIFLGLAVATVGVFVFQTLTTRREALADVMMNAREPATYPPPRPDVDGALRKLTEDEKRLSA